MPPPSIPVVVVENEKALYQDHSRNLGLCPTTTEVRKENFVASAKESEIDVEDFPRSSQQDPNIVDWDGPDDPENPLNWSAFRRWGTIALVAGITFLAPLGSSYIAPGVPEIMKEVSLLVYQPTIVLC